MSPRIGPIPFQLALNKRQVILTILGYNAYCLLIHSLTKPLGRSVDSTRYLHGGLTIEFIGDKALTSRASLIIWDIVVMILQLSMFTLNFPTSQQDQDQSLEHEELEEGSSLRNRDSYGYSGQIVVKDITIFKSLIDNWNFQSPQPVENSQQENSQDQQTSTQV